MSSPQSRPKNDCTSTRRRHRLGELLDSHEFPALDGVRGLAISLVLLIHFSYLAHHAIGQRAGVHSALALVAPLADLGGTGVHLFFVLSGTLLFIPFARHMFGGAKVPNTRSFYVRRARRILPAYYAALVLTIVIFGDPLVDAAPVTQLLSHFLLLHDYSARTLGGIDGPTWTLAIEGQFYLLLPLLAAGLFVLARRGHGAVMVGVGLLVLCSPISSAVVVGVKHAFGAHDYTVFDAISFLSTFGAGIAVACICVALDEGILRISRQRVGYLGLLAFALIFGVYLMQSWIPVTNATLNYYCFTLLFGVCYAGLLLFVLLIDSPASRLLARPACRAWGQISYSVYLVHYPLMEKVVMPLARDTSGELGLATAVVGSFAIIVPAACAMHFGIERPLMRRHPNRAAPEPAAAAG